MVFFRFASMGKVEKTRFERNLTTFVNPAFSAAWKSPPKICLLLRRLDFRSNKERERKARVTGEEHEARGTTGRRRKERETPARKRVDFVAILSFSWHPHFSAFLSLGSGQFQ